MWAYYANAASVQPTQLLLDISAGSVCATKCYQPYRSHHVAIASEVAPAITCHLVTSTYCMAM